MNQTIKKAVTGLLFLFIVMCGAIFLSAGSFSFWQGWVFLCAFFIPTIIITLDLMKHDMKLLERRVSAGVMAERRTGQKIIQGFANVFFLGIIIVPGFDHRFHWSHIPVWLVFLSNLCIAAGFIIVYLVFKVNTFTSATIEIDDNQTVVSSGLYKIVRHPMYLGGLLIIVSMPMALGSLWALLAAVPIVISIIARLLDEEKYLIKGLSGYDEYCQKVKYHLIPYVW